jgi:putative CocE/NonD family hydrolase
MTLLSRLLEWYYDLPPPETTDVAVETGLEVPMPDGAVLRADRYSPRGYRDRPTLLVRTPYGRSRLGLFWGRPFAERGFQVVVQSCRGTDDSDGAFTPFRNEGADGVATVEWVQDQPWFDGRLGMTGPSYMGYTQWALAPEVGSKLDAMSTQVTTSEFHSAIHAGGSLSLQTMLQWMVVVDGIDDPLPSRLLDALTAKRRVDAAASHLPLYSADEVLVGRPVRFWREWLDHTDRDDDYWQAQDYSEAVADVSVPNHLIGGWYDIFLPHLLRDYTTLREAGHDPFLTIGPWSHSSTGLFQTSFTESLRWLRAHLLDEPDALRDSPVRVYVMGADEWRDLSAWPPSDVREERWYLHGGASLSTEAPTDSSPSRYWYDPADPTPTVGGPILGIMGRGGGAADNREVEARPDVLVFTSRRLDADLECIGPVAADVYLASSLDHTDCFVRLCDVLPSGRSVNVSDALVRLSPDSHVADADADGVHHVQVDLWPTAYRFEADHRIRLQVASGAFPRFPRNLGTGESLAHGTAMRVAAQRVYHDEHYPSSVSLPVVDS